MHNFLASDRWLIREKWWITYEHLEQNAANTPPVDCLIIPILTKNFWGNIVWSSHCRERQLPCSFVPQLFVKSRLQLIEVEWELLGVNFGHSWWPDLGMFAETKVSEFDVAVSVDKDIIWLQVTVNEIDFMNWFDRKNCLCDIESTFFFAQDILSHKQSH